MSLHIRITLFAVNEVFNEKLMLLLKLKCEVAFIPLAIIHCAHCEVLPGARDPGEGHTPASNQVTDPSLTLIHT